MKKTTMLKKNYEFKTVLTKGKCFKEKEIEIFILKNPVLIKFCISYQSYNRPPTYCTTTHYCNTLNLYSNIIIINAF